jgi:hypothetical protein
MLDQIASFFLVYEEQPSSPVSEFVQRPRARKSVAVRIKAASKTSFRLFLKKSSFMSWAFWSHQERGKTVAIRVQGSNMKVFPLIHESSLLMYLSITFGAIEKGKTATSTVGIAAIPHSAKTDQ